MVQVTESELPALSATSNVTIQLNDVPEGALPPPQAPAGPVMAPEPQAVAAAVEIGREPVQVAMVDERETREKPAHRPDGKL